MSEEIITGSGGSSALLRGLLIAAPFFLFLYYVQVSSEKIKELKQGTTITSDTATMVAVTPITEVLQRDSALISQNTILLEDNKALEQRIDSVLKLVVISNIPPPSDNGDVKMFEDSFNIYKGNYLNVLSQLNECRAGKDKLMNIKKYYSPPVIIK